MSDKSETIPDIIWAMRQLASRHTLSARVANYVGEVDNYLAIDIRSFADRLEAAYKREIEISDTLQEATSMPQLNYSRFDGVLSAAETFAEEVVGKKSPTQKEVDELMQKEWYAFCLWLFTIAEKKGGSK